MPKEVNQAIIGIWITIGLSVLSALFNRWSDAISTGDFAGYIFIYALFCIFPYKLGKGSNPARWIYSILAVASMLFMLGGVGSDMPKADLVVSVIMVPIEIFIIAKLFQSEVSLWFSQESK